MTTATLITTDRRAERWTTDHARVAEAIEWLDAHRVDQPRLADVAAALHLSTSHLQRTFTRFAGTSPTRFLRWLTVDAARELLRERSTVLDTAATVGLSSTGRLHDLLVTVDAVTPGEVGTGGAGLSIAVGLHPTPFGDALVGVTERGVCALRFVDGDPEAARRELAADWPRAEIVSDAAGTAEVAARVAAAIDGGLDGRPLRLLLRGTNLQLKVWEALLRVPDDRVTTYGDVARAVGRPDAVRAVASAVGRNPVAWLVPCHRVLRATGQFGGYRWGEVRKRALLAREAARGEAGEPPTRAAAL